MNRSGKTDAFTMAEVLVAASVLSLMVIMLVGVLNRTGGAWVAGQAQSERRQSARVMADSMARELGAALLPLDPADPTSLQFLFNPDVISDTYRNPDALFWQAPIASDRSRGDVAEVGYFLKWDITNPGNPRPLFCRFFVNPNDAAHYLILKTPGEWLSDAILDALAPANNALVPGSDTERSAYRGLFAENVIGFWVRCYGKDGKLIVPAGAYDSRQTRTLPVSVKIYWVLIDPQALPRLRAIPDYSRAGGTDQEPDLETFITALPGGVRETARIFTAEIHLRNAL